LLKTVKRDKRDLRLSYTQNIEIKNPGIACCPFHFCIEFSQVSGHPTLAEVPRATGSGTRTGSLTIAEMALSAKQNGLYPMPKKIAITYDLENADHQILGCPIFRTQM
jgi:hypothetical protein